MTEEKRPEDVSQGIDLHLLDPRTMTFDDIAKLFEKLKGRNLSPDEYEDARLFWNKLDAKKKD